MSNVFGKNTQMNCDRVHAWTILKKYHDTAEPLQKLILQLFKLLLPKRPSKKQDYEQMLNTFRIQHFNKFVFDCKETPVGSETDLFVSTIATFDRLDKKNRKHFDELLKSLLKFKKNWPGGHSNGTPLLVYWDPTLTLKSTHYESIWYIDEVTHIRKEMQLTGPLAWLKSPRCPATQYPTTQKASSTEKDYLDKTSAFVLPDIPQHILKIQQLVTNMYIYGFENAQAELQDIILQVVGNPDTHKYTETQLVNVKLASDLRQTTDTLHRLENMYRECQLTLERSTQREMYEIQSRDAYIRQMSQNLRASQIQCEQMSQFMNERRIGHNGQILRPPLPQNSPPVIYNRSY